jgi:hypothetical protein
MYESSKGNITHTIILWSSSGILHNQSIYLFRFIRLNLIRVRYRRYRIVLLTLLR